MKDHKLQLGRFFSQSNPPETSVAFIRKRVRIFFPTFQGGNFPTKKVWNHHRRILHDYILNFLPVIVSRGIRFLPTMLSSFLFIAFFLNVFQLKIGKPFVGNEKNEGPRIPPPFIHFPLANHEPSIPKIFGYSGMGRLNLS